MSEERIKQIIRHNDTQYGSPVPIGTEGIYVDTLSGLDLEEELRIGSYYHYVQIEEDYFGVTTIKQWYFIEPIVQASDLNDYKNSNDKQKYYIETKISESASLGTHIAITLCSNNQTNDNQLVNVLHNKTIAIQENESTIIKEGI